MQKNKKGGLLSINGLYNFDPSIVKDKKMQADCEYEMGASDGAVCAWAPGICKSWCRANAAAWAPTAVAVFDEINAGTFAGFAIHIDVLSIPYIRHMITLDEHVADMHVETMEALGIDGIFGTGVVLGKRRDDLQRGVKCSLNVAGLWKTILITADSVVEPPKPVLDAWRDWLEIPTSKDRWEVKSLHIGTTPSGQYILVNSDDRRSIPQTRDQAIEAVAKTMSDDLRNVRMAESRLSYIFVCKTNLWAFPKRRALASLLTLVSKENSELLQRVCVSNDVVSYVFQPMGPHTSPHLGNIHVSLKRPPPNGSPEITWGSAMYAQITINLNPKLEFYPIEIQVATCW